MDSDFQVHSIERDLPSCSLDFVPFRRILIEDWVGVVDVNVDAALARKFRQRREAPVRTADWQMTHRKRGFRSHALRDHFIVGPAGAIKEDAVACREDFLETSIDILDAGNVRDRFTALSIDEFESDRGFIGTGRKTEVGWRLARHGERLIEESALTPIDADDRTRPGQFDAFPSALAGSDAQHSEDSVGAEDPSAHGVSGIKPERLRLAKRQQSRDMIDIGVGEEYRLNGRTARGASWMQAREDLDLLTDIRAGIREVPSLAISADCDGRLCPRSRTKGAIANAAAVAAIAVPLRESPTCTRAEDVNTHVEVSSPAADSEQNPRERSAARDNKC